MSSRPSKAVVASAGSAGPLDSPVLAFLQVHRRSVVLALCLLAGIRILVFAAAFPFFTNVDEPAHFDLIEKYSLGHLPARELEPLSRHTAELMVFHATPQYLTPRSQYPPGAILAPPGDDPALRASPAAQAALAQFQALMNHETGSFPVYYLAAGFWGAVGRSLGLADAQWVYWIRFLNVPIAMALVFLAHGFARALAPGRPFFHFALPLLIAFFPQDVFYGLNSDVPAPLLFGLALLLLWRITFEDHSYAQYVLAGLAVAAAFLTKISNAFILVPLLAAVLGMLHQARRTGAWRTGLLRLAALLLAAFLPIGLWLGRNQLLFGDAAASTQRLALLTWTVKPLMQVADHPLFTPAGLGHFFSELITSFWRGELVWHTQPIASPVVDAFYLGSTALFIAVSVLHLAVRWPRLDARWRAALLGCFVVVLLGVLFLASISVRYDFGRDSYPSRKMPYLMSGRLIGGVLLPFAVIYLDGLALVFSAFLRRLSPIWIVLALVAAITINETLLTVDVFASRYNWFHLF